MFTYKNIYAAYPTETPGTIGKLLLRVCELNYEWGACFLWLLISVPFALLQILKWSINFNASHIFNIKSVLWNVNDREKTLKWYLNYTTVNQKWVVRVKMCINLRHGKQLLCLKAEDIGLYTTNGTCSPPCSCCSQQCPLKHSLWNSDPRNSAELGVGIGSGKGELAKLALPLPVEVFWHRQEMIIGLFIANYLLLSVLWHFYTQQTPEGRSQQLITNNSH